MFWKTCFLALGLAICQTAGADDYLEEAVELFPNAELDSPLNKSLQTSNERGSELPKLILEADPAFLSSRREVGDTSQSLADAPAKKKSAPFD